MRPIYPLLLFSLTLISCAEQKKADLPKSKAPEIKTTSAKQAVINKLPDDPTFVATKDTVSLYGPHNITRNILQDRKGNIWFASWQGIMRYDGKFFTNVSLQEGLGHYHIFSLLEDRSGNIWFGAIGGGVYRYHQASGVFTHFTDEDGLADNAVLCMLEDRSGKIWFGTKDAGVCYYDPAAAGFTGFTTKDGLAHNQVNSIMQDQSGKLWFGTVGGVSCYDASPSLMTAGKSFTGFTTEKGLRFSNVSSILQDKNGAVWIGNQNGLCRYDPVSGERSYVAADFIRYVFEDSKGNLWLSEASSPDMVLSKYDGKSIARIKKEYQVFGITEDSNGDIWFGTVNGVRRYDGTAFTDFLEKDGMQ